MNISTLPFHSIPFFSKRDHAFQNGNESLMSFVPYKPSEEDLIKAIAHRQNYPIDRVILTSNIEQQYKKIGFSPNQKIQLENLKSDNTFTVTTAHQPSLFTGPFYFILKICSTIHLAQKLTAMQSNKIVPIFIIGGEDHDFEEINHTSIFGKTLHWNRESLGAVGRLDLEDFESQAIESLFELLGDSKNATEIKEIIQTSYKQSDTYGEFAFNMVNQLFAEYGLLVLSFDQVDFKKRFIPIIKKEIFESQSIGAVQKTQEAIESNGFKKQAHAREINFFYFYKNRRLRIEKMDNDSFSVVDSDLFFSKKELLQEIEDHPERFSPNVIIRPIFQEFILPNIAYIGGGGELAYWMERRSQFEIFETFFPVLIRRNSAMYVSKKQKESLQQLDVSLSDLMQDSDLFIKQYVQDHSDESISLEESKAEIQTVFEKLLAKTNQIDKSLEGKIKALHANQIKELDKLEQRLIKKLKANQEININKIKKARNQLFPGNGLQERKTNFIEFYLKEGSSFIPKLIEHCNPLNTDFTIFEES